MNTILGFRPLGGGIRTLSLSHCKSETKPVFPLSKPADPAGMVSPKPSIFPAAIKADCVGLTGFSFDISIGTSRNKIDRHAYDIISS